MSKETDAKSRFNTSHPSASTSSRGLRPKNWRLARSAVIVLGVGAIAALAVFLLTTSQSKVAFADPETCTTLQDLRPGPARPWEADIAVSTYSRVNTHHGNLFTAIPIVGWSGIGPDMNMMLFHNSANVSDQELERLGYSIADVVGFDLGPGWSISYSDHLRFNQLPDPTVITAVRADGTQDVYNWNSYLQKWIAPNGVYNELSQDVEDSAIWRLKHKDQSIHQFSTQYGCNDEIARLEKIIDGTGNQATVSYAECEPLNPTPVVLQYVLAAGRVLNFELETEPGPELGLLRTIRDPWDGDAGTQERHWTFGYDDSATFNYWLKEVVDPMNNRNVFTYDTDGEDDLIGRLKFIGDKCVGCSASNLPAQMYTYNYADGRLSLVDDPEGIGGGLDQEISITCQVVGQGQIVFYNTRTTYTNRRGNSWVYTYPEGGSVGVPANAGTLEWVQSPVGMSRYTFDGAFNLISFRDANWNVWSSTYDSRGDRLTLTDPLDHVQTWTYDSVNNVTSHTDAAGNTVRYYYDLATANPSRPTLLTRIVEPSDTANPPLGEETGFPVTQLTYYSNGQLESVTDPNGVWTGFEYDQWGQQSKYIEGRWESQVAGGGWNYGNWNTMIPASDGNGTGGSGSGGTGGAGSHDANGNPTSSGCTSDAAAGGGPPNSWPPMKLPCNTPTIPGRSAEFTSASYSPKGELLELPLNLGFGTRTHNNSYDVMGRPLSVSVVSNEADGSSFPRAFTYSYDVANGNYTRTGPDGLETFVQLDAADRVQSVHRGPSGSPLMTATYTYLSNGYINSITYGNLAVVQYFYEAHRLSSIVHLAAPSIEGELMRLDYEYTANDLPWRITEYPPGSPGQPPRATTTFTYDRRNRLTRETRVGSDGYDLEYQYDKGGNRTVKIDHEQNRRVEYHFDVDAGANPNVYGSLNNRLMWYETFDTTYPSWPETVSKTYYVYTYDPTYEPSRVGKTDGNPTRIITEYPPAVIMQSMTTGGETESSESSTAAPAVEGGGMAAMGGGGGGGEGGGGGSCEGLPTYTSVRLGYAHNGRAVTFVHDESWCWNQVQSCAGVMNYAVNWAREYRYDGARARYLDRKLDGPLFKNNSLVELGATWSDYDGDEAYGDYAVTPGSPPTVMSTDKYEPGLWRLVGGLNRYLHNDHLGTLRTTSTGGGAGGAIRTFTAFGEPITQITDRYGYVGAFGYQSHSIPESLDPDNAFPYMHVGARYYDPSSGRFLQRDMIGIEGGANVFTYSRGKPTTGIDPDGLDIIDIVIGLDPIIDGVINGKVGGLVGAGATAGTAANYQWKLGLGRLFNRSAVACAGSWIGWNAGKLLDKLGLSNALGKLLAPIVGPGDGPGTPAPPPPPKLHPMPPLEQIMGGLLG